MSFLEALDHLNELLVLRDEKVIAYEYDCREGICGQCGVFINGHAHGPHPNMTTCQLHMRSFSDGDAITVEPWRAKSFPIIRDLVVDRSAFDRIIEAGAYISSKTGTAPEANAIPIPKALQTKLWMHQLVLNVVPVWLIVKTLQPHYSHQQRSII